MVFDFDILQWNLAHICPSIKLTRQADNISLLCNVIDDIRDISARNLQDGICWVVQPGSTDTLFLYIYIPRDLRLLQKGIAETIKGVSKRCFTLLDFFEQFHLLCCRLAAILSSHQVMGFPDYFIPSSTHLQFHL